MSDTNSTDAKVTANLIETLKDGADGYTTVADLVHESDRPGLEPTFRNIASQRSAAAHELEALAASYGDDMDEDGSALASAHRVWLKVKDTLTGSDPEGVLQAALNGEEKAVEAFDEALEADISPHLRQVVTRLRTEVVAAKDLLTAASKAS